MEDQKVNITISPAPDTTLDDIININNDNNEIIETESNENINIEDNTENVDETPSIDENPLNNISEKQIADLMKKIRDLMGLMESQWEASRKEFKLNDAYMRKLFDYNEAHKNPIPSELTSNEARSKWENDNQFSGFDKISEEDVLGIFGKDHPIIGVEHNITISRIKDVYRDFVSWISTVQEYRKIYDSYMELIEFQEKESLNELQKKADEESDPEKKAIFQKSIDTYYYRKYLDFLAEPLEEKQINRLVAAFTNPAKIEYLIERGRAKLNSMNITSKFILEISQFEKRFLSEKYYHQNNIFLLYFLELIVYASDIYNKTDENRNKAICIIFALDRIIRRSWSEEIYNHIMTNVVAFEDQFLGKIVNTKKEVINETINKAETESK